MGLTITGRPRPNQELVENLQTAGAINTVPVSDGGGNLAMALPGVSQTNVAGIAQVFGSSTPTNITGASTFIGQGSEFDNGGSDDLTIRYIGALAKLIEFRWHCVVREDPNGGGSDGEVNVHLAVAGGIIPASKTTSPVDSNHGGTASGQFIRLSTQNEVFELFADRTSGAGDGAITDVVFSAQIL